MSKVTPAPTGFSRILIANRGEIACRVIRSARALGYRTVAVHSEADHDALHVRLADEAVCIGPPAARESYLRIDALLDAAKQSGADAVHPGYGFLSENAEFAEACGAAGLTFIGPSPHAIQAMGNKAAAKRLMLAAGVPCVPGYEGEDQSDDMLIEQAGRIGFPLMVKAAAGGGGRGMRLVSKPEDLAKALASARSEATNAFGSGELILEKAIVEPRHIEIQVFGDSHGNIIHLGERDCSIQRRHQKVIEEAPSPAVSTELRQAMGTAAVAAARAIDYVGAGTVEFLLDPAGHFYFLEMNTRLQVEHPVTEMITGQDLVAWQLKVAAGEALPLEQHEVRLQGHAIEARLYAEDPYRNFLPQSGLVSLFDAAAGDGVRVDHGLASGQVISPYYDPMIAKVIAHGENRDIARRRLAVALEDTLVLGINTNRRFLADMLRHPAFAAGEATTAFIPTHFAPKSAAMSRPEIDPGLHALAAAVLFEAARHGAGGTRPLGLAANWHSSGAAAWPLRLALGDRQSEATLTVQAPNHYRVAFADSAMDVTIIERGASHLRFAIDGRQRGVRYALVDGALLLDSQGVAARFTETLLDRGEAAEGAGDAQVLAPMNGRIVAVLTKPGESVTKGQRLVVLEAMKMQHELTAGRAGTVERVAVKEGDQVATRQLLVALAAEA